MQGRCFDRATLLPNKPISVNKNLVFLICKVVSWCLATIFHKTYFNNKDAKNTKMLSYFEQDHASILTLISYS